MGGTCTDGILDGSETDVDCGGGACPACPVGKKCQADPDCTSNACDALTLICVPSQCLDHRKDGLETDIDCGGGACQSCAQGLGCLANFDCTSGICLNQICQ